MCVTLGRPPPTRRLDSGGARGRRPKSGRGRARGRRRGGAARAARAARGAAAATHPTRTAVAEAAAGSPERCPGRGGRGGPARAGLASSSSRAAGARAGRGTGATAGGGAQSSRECPSPLERCRRLVRLLGPRTRHPPARAGRLPCERALACWLCRVYFGGPPGSRRGIPNGRGARRRRARRARAAAAGGARRTCGEGQTEHVREGVRCAGADERARDGAAPARVCSPHSLYPLPAWVLLARKDKVRVARNGASLDGTAGGGRRRAREP